MGYSTIEHRCNASRKIVKVTIVGFILACLTILEGMACSFAYAEVQAEILTVDTTDEPLPEVESYAAVSEPPMSVTIASKSVIEPIAVQVESIQAEFPGVSSTPFSSILENAKAELSPATALVQPAAPLSLPSSTAIIATNSAPLPEGAMPQTRIIAPVSVSPSTVDVEIRHEKTEAQYTGAENTAATAAVSEVIEDSFTEDSLTLDASLPDTSTGDMSASEILFSPTVNSGGLPEGAVPTARVFSPQSSSQALVRIVSEQDTGVIDRVEGGLTESIIAQATGAVDTDLGPLILNNGSTPFGTADENTALPVSPSELPPPQNVVPIEPEPEPELEPFELPPADNLLGPSEPPNQPPLPTDDVTFEIEEFTFDGNTVFSDQDLTDATAEFLLDELQTFADVANAREAVTQLYVNEGYATSGAIVPPQSVTDGVVKINIIEGSLDDIVVQGTQRLRSGYISSRIGLSTAPPLNVNRLVERLQLLQSDPLIESISADLQASPEAGKNTLVVSVAEADSFGVTYALDNNRSPSVGTVRHQFGVSEGNLLGFGDRLAVDYTLTSGSDGFGFDYTVPVSPYDTTLGVSVNLADSEVIEDPFDVLEIESDSEAYEVSLRHPLKRTPTEELAIGLTASHQRTQTELGFDDIGPFPLSPGADDDGRTRVSALRFFQDWTHRSTKQVLALRSQFNVGIDALGATVNDDAPDSQFFSWQGQAQWLKLLAADTPLIVKGSAQLTPDSLLSLEQLSLGGQSTVRGYRQNFLSTDNGVSASAEVRLPIARERSSDTLLQLAPFVDAGYGWNNDGEDPDPIVGVGLGLVFQHAKRFSARLDWGIPLTDAGNNRDSWQESGVYFSLRHSFF